MRYIIKRFYLNKEQTKWLVFEQNHSCHILPLLCVNIYAKKLQEFEFGWLHWTMFYGRDDNPPKSSTDAFSLE